MARTWLSIQIELIDGGGQTLWPRPGRIFAAARSHTFAQLDTAIDRPVSLGRLGRGTMPTRRTG